MILAAQGNTFSQNLLGIMYATGSDGMQQDDEEAGRWFRLAAAQGNADAAQNNLGAIYETGRGVQQDDEEAVKWYQMAATQGDADAQFNRGTMCVIGRGVQRDNEEAVKWFPDGGRAGKCRRAENPRPPWVTSSTSCAARTMSARASTSAPAIRTRCRQRLS